MSEAETKVESVKAARADIAAHKFSDEATVVQQLLKNRPFDAITGREISDKAEQLVQTARDSPSTSSLVDTFLSEYGLSNSEGISLMCLAESLLRVPDQATANQLIADKVSLADWASHSGAAESSLVNASTWALMLTGKVIDLDRSFGRDPKRWLTQLTNRLSEPVVQAAMRSAMQILGREFVLGKTIDKAIARASKTAPYSFDMLGEAAKTSEAAAKYRAAYADAIESIGAHISKGNLTAASISIKLSALHPRYEAAQSRRVMLELVPIVRDLAKQAASHGLELTIDAEECDRLEISLDAFEALAVDAELSRWQGLGIVVQAYSKRAPMILTWLSRLSELTGRRFPLRLVKGAYWDAEIKHAQVMGYPGFPVYTRKVFTDCAYLSCARFLLDHQSHFKPQFATHNAHTVAAIMEMATADHDIEFQCLHGMGGALYAAAPKVYQQFPPIRTYAPVGGYDDLLAYLVRRLLENGANSSFVNRFLDKKLPAADIVSDPFLEASTIETAAHPKVVPPKLLFSPSRLNSEGIDLTANTWIEKVQSMCQQPADLLLRVASSTASDEQNSRGDDGGTVAAEQQMVDCIEVRNPANTSELVGRCQITNNRAIALNCQRAKQAQAYWDQQGGVARAKILRVFADKLEADRLRLMSILTIEAGKTIPDALAEVREAVDLCRYYAAQAEQEFEVECHLPGPTGERNTLSLHGRGVFACISPWNFPLAIFVGQVSAALAAGNSVVAKPAEETPLIASEAIALLYQAGVPEDVCQLVMGDGAAGECLVANADIDGVAFTGSTEVARAINIALAQKSGAITPMIAETGGQNVMVVDSTALLEQVVDDVIASAFLSAGQRCSALRILLVQEDIAEATIAIIRGAMDQLTVGNPAVLATDVGPVISESAAETLNAHVARLEPVATILHQVALPSDSSGGHFVAPTMIEIASLDQLQREVFGPILHVMRYSESEFSGLINQVNNTGYGLTFGIHSRIDSRVQKLAQQAKVGNVYANRNMTGAVVGSQPFGGQGLSGTGPKAGGPHYLHRFAVEKTISINTVATGGNAELLQM